VSDDRHVSKTPGLFADFLSVVRGVGQIGL